MIIVRDKLLIEFENYSQYHSQQEGVATYDNSICCWHNRCLFTCYETCIK